MSETENSQSGNSSNFQEELSFALSLAEQADAISLSRYRALDLQITTKPDNTPVTDADRAVEQAIRNAITARFPADKIVGEEFGGSQLSHDDLNRYWVIDPIDGTKNFLRGVPTWATLIALVVGGEVVASVVSSPALYRRWYATRGGGAYLSENGSTPRLLHVSAVESLSDASIAYSDFQGWGERRNAFENLLDGSWRTRGLGDFWSHMLVAEGSVDAAIEPSLALWDMAALDLIVTEAGGRFTSLDGVDGPFGPNAISSNSKIHNQILSALNGKEVNTEGENNND
jgi:histidinol-phosphatase